MKKVTYKNFRLPVALVVVTILIALTNGCSPSHGIREVKNFNTGWKFKLGDDERGFETLYNDSLWRILDVPHDWSIEGKFAEQHPAGVGGGALPGGIGWYRKTFHLPKKDVVRKVFIQFDGVYRNSEVWINGHKLGKRPNGYISFEYELTPFLHYGGESNVIAVKVDNASQPNSRWYSGSGIYRDVKLVFTNEVFVPYNGTFITTPEVNSNKAVISIQTEINNASSSDQEVKITATIFSEGHDRAAEVQSTHIIASKQSKSVRQELTLLQPQLWSTDSPKQYKAMITLTINGKYTDEYETLFGVRTVHFDSANGFFLNNQSIKIKGVCLHHDLGCLGAAFNRRAAERQLEIMRGMGVNAIRTSHNPPAPEFLDLCDSMGFLVMDELFDMWKKRKSEFDYSLDWDEWHERDLEDFIKRDRNHPSVIVWSIGNEIGEQWDSTGSTIAQQLVVKVKSLDDTRPITTANNEVNPAVNQILKSNAFELIGYNYNHLKYEQFPTDYPGKKFIATETTSALATRGHYDMPSDSIRRWPIRWDKLFTQGNPDNTVSSYDNVSAPWGSTHEETWRVVKHNQFISGMFIWTGFDYLGEPTPYVWPSRSSYFGVVDLAGFPKDAYYMYKSEWTTTPVLHLFPHWNWKEGQLVDVWVYYNEADEVELFLNGKSQGVKSKSDTTMHVMWRLPFVSGVIKAISRKSGKEVLIKEIKTAGKAYKLDLKSDRTAIKANGDDLSFITVSVLDADGVVVPYAENEIEFIVKGQGAIAGVDNGSPVSHEPFKGSKRKAFHGLALVVIKSTPKKGNVTVEASAAGLKSASLQLETR